MKAEQLLRKNNLDETAWGMRIIRAEISGKFTSANKVSAEKWSCCACGKLDKRIPRFHDQPKDRKLLSLGYSFTDYVQGNEFYQAAGALIKIEKRAVWILARLPK